MHHLSLSVRGALTNWTKKDMGRLLQHDDRRTMTASEAREALLEELSKGHEVVPMGECNNFDFKKGCLGHEEDKK